MQCAPAGALTLGNLTAVVEEMCCTCWGAGGTPEDISTAAQAGDALPPSRRPAAAAAAAAADTRLVVLEELLLLVAGRAACLQETLARWAAALGVLSVLGILGGL